MITERQYSWQTEARLWKTLLPKEVQRTECAKDTVKHESPRRGMVCRKGTGCESMVIGCNFMRQERTVAMGI